MTGPRRLTLVAAVGLAVALAAAIVAIARFGVRVRRGEIAGDVRRGGLVVALAPSAAVRIAVEADGARAELVRDGARWRPARAGDPGDGAAVPPLLEQLTALRRRTTSASEHGREELSAYGLDRPRARIAIGLKGGAALDVAIGQTTGPDGITFVQAPDGTVTMVASTAGEALLDAAHAVLARGAPPAAAPPVPAGKPEG